MLAIALRIQTLPSDKNTLSSAQTAWKQFPSWTLSHSPAEFLVAKQLDADRDGNSIGKYPILDTEPVLESLGMRSMPTPPNMRWFRRVLAQEAFGIMYSSTFHVSLYRMGISGIASPEQEAQPVSRKNTIVGSPCYENEVRTRLPGPP